MYRLSHSLGEHVSQSDCDGSHETDVKPISQPSCLNDGIEPIRRVDVMASKTRLE